MVLGDENQDPDRAKRAEYLAYLRAKEKRLRKMGSSCFVNPFILVPPYLSPSGTRAMGRSQDAIRDGSTGERCAFDLIIQVYIRSMCGCTLISLISAIRDKMAARDQRQPPGQA